MKNEIGKEHPFDKTKRFVREAVENFNMDELEFPKDLIDFDKPYTQIDEKFFQSVYPVIKMQAGDEIPLVSMPINEPPSKETPSFRRRPNAALLYIFADEKDENEKFGTLAQIGSAYGVTREMTRKDVKNHIQSLHRLATNDTKIKHPLKEICLKKPMGMNIRVNLSMALGGTTLQIRDSVKSGKDTQDLKKEFGTQKVSLARKTLAAWGDVNVPERENRDFTKIIDKINNPNVSTEDLKNLILEFNSRTLVTRYGRGPKPVIIGISHLQYEVFGNKNLLITKEIFELLKEYQIPVNSIAEKQNLKNGKTITKTRYITLYKTLDVARDVLERYKDQYFHRYVDQINGEMQDEIPNTYQLFGTRKGGYVKVSKKTAYTIMESDSQIPIFKYQNSKAKFPRFYVPRDYLPELQQFS